MMAQLGGAPELEVEDGLQSATFEVPVDRPLAGMAEVRQAMRLRDLGFDEARLQLVHKRMAQMNVDITGMPKDPKTFTFDQLGVASPKPCRHSTGAGGAAPRRLSSTATDPATAAVTEPSPKHIRRPACCECLAKGLPTKVMKPVRGSMNELLLRALLLTGLGLVFFLLRTAGWQSGALPTFLVQDPNVLKQTTP